MSCASSRSLPARSSRPPSIPGSRFCSVGVALSSPLDRSSGGRTLMLFRVGANFWDPIVSHSDQPIHSDPSLAGSIPVLAIVLDSALETCYKSPRLADCLAVPTEGLGQDRRAIHVHVLASSQGLKIKEHAGMVGSSVESDAWLRVTGPLSGALSWSLTVVRLSLRLDRVLGVALLSRV